jgi:hypothetical protein
MNRYSNAVYLLALAATLPIFIEYATTVWTRGHYQFLPLLIIVVGWLIYFRLTESPPVPSKSETWFSSIFLV